jgi:hypothetical protein
MPGQPRDVDLLFPALNRSCRPSVDRDRETPEDVDLPLPTLYCPCQPVEPVPGNPRRYCSPLASVALIFLPPASSSTAGLDSSGVEFGIAPDLRQHRTAPSHRSAQDAVVLLLLLTDAGKSPRTRTVLLWKNIVLGIIHRRARLVRRGNRVMANPGQSSWASICEGAGPRMV